MVEAPHRVVGQVEAGEVPEVVEGVVDDVPGWVGDARQASVGTVPPADDAPVGCDEFDQTAALVAAVGPRGTVGVHPARQTAGVVVAESSRRTRR